MLKLIFLIASVASLILGLFVLVRGKNKLLNRTFFYFCMSVIGWLFTNFMVQIVTNGPQLISWYRLTYTTITLTIYLLVYLALQFVENNNKKRKNISTLLFLPTIIVIFITTKPTLIESAGYSSEGFVFRFSDLFFGFLIYTLLYLFVTFYLFFKSYKKRKGSEKEQVKFMLLGIFVASIFAVLTDLILPLFGITYFANYGPAGIIFFVLMSSYAIIAHRLFDIKVIIRRTVVYSVLLAFVLGVYSAVVFASASILGGTADINRSTMIPNLIAAILIAIGFEPLRKFLTRVTDKYLFKQAYDPQQVLKQLSDTLVSVLALDEALLSMMNIVKGAFRISHTAVLVIYDESTEENQVRLHSVGYMGVQKNGLNIKISDPIIKYIRQKRSLEVVEELERRLEDENITSSRVKQLVKGANVDPLDIIRQVKIIGSVVKKAKSLEIAVLIPIIVRDKVIGIFIIGPKMSGDSFTDADLKTLEIISGQTASAIEQARLYEDDQTKSEFVSIASHELLTPTTAIEGYLSMILDEHMANVDETARKYLERVQTSAHRLSNLVKDLLSVSRLEAGRIKVKIEPVQVEPLIENVVSDLLPTTQEKRLSLTFLKPDETLPLCLADPDKLTQIIINMVGNAIKYTPEGSVLVLAESVDDKIKITVEDTGVGIKQEDLPHLFEKFYRVDNTETVGIVGSGLGLYVTKSLIELMNGQIEVESTEWHGSRFIVIFPVAKEVK